MKSRIKIEVVGSYGLLRGRTIKVQNGPLLPFLLTRRYHLADYEPIANFLGTSSSVSPRQLHYDD